MLAKICLFLICLQPGIAMTKIECYRNEAVKEIRPILDEWAISDYREYPYLYVYQGESDYNTIFEVDPTAFVLFAVQDGQKIGHISANALDSPYFGTSLYTPATVLEEIRGKGIDPAKVLYISCFLMKDRLNRDAACELFHRAVEIGREMGKTDICYMGIREDLRHPLRPNPYIPIEPWSLLDAAFQKIGVEIVISWPTLQQNGDVEEEAHTLEFFMTKIATH